MNGLWVRCGGFGLRTSLELSDLTVAHWQWQAGLPILCSSSTSLPGILYHYYNILFTHGIHGHKLFCGLWNYKERLYDPATPTTFFFPLKVDPHRGTAKFHCQLGIDLQPFEYINGNFWLQLLFRNRKILTYFSFTHCSFNTGRSCLEGIFVFLQVHSKLLLNGANFLDNYSFPSRYYLAITLGCPLLLSHQSAHLTFLPIILIFYCRPAYTSSITTTQHIKIDAILKCPSQK